MQIAPYKLLIGDREIIDSVEMANAFNDHFLNIGREITSLIPSVNKSPLNYLNKSCESSFFLSPATVEEIELEILKLNISKSVGPYSIPTCLINVYIAVCLDLLQICITAHSNVGLYQISLKWLELFLFLRVGIKLVLAIIDQFLYCHSLIKFWRN